MFGKVNPRSLSAQLHLTSRAVFLCILVFGGFWVFVTFYQTSETQPIKCPEQAPCEEPKPCDPCPDPPEYSPCPEPTTAESTPCPSLPQCPMCPACEGQETPSKQFESKLWDGKSVVPGPLPWLERCRFVEVPFSYMAYVLTEFYLPRRFSMCIRDYNDIVSSVIADQGRWIECDPLVRTDLLFLTT